MKGWHIGKWAGTAVLLALSGGYLTWLIDRVTLSTWLQRMFIFLYFAAGSTLLLLLRKRFGGQNGHEKRRTILVCSVIGAVFCVVFGRDMLFPQANSARVGLSNISQAAQGQGGEVWLISLKLDGKEVSLSGLEVLEDRGWVYSDANDDFYCMEAEENHLLLELPMHCEAELGFISSAWSGSAEVTYGGGAPEEVILYAAEESAGLYTVDLEIGQTMSAWAMAVLCLGALVIFSFLFSWGGEAYCLYRKRGGDTDTKAPPIRWSKRVEIALVSLLVIGSVWVQQAGQYTPLWITQRDSAVTFVNQGKDPNGNAGEVWLKLLEGGRQIAPEDILIPKEESGWEIRNGCYFSFTKGAELTLPCKIPSEVKFVFQSHAWTGQVSVQWEGQEEHYNFYSAGGTEERIDAPWSGTDEVTYNWRNLGLYAVLGCLIWGVLLWFLMRNHQSAWFMLFAISWGAAALIALDAEKWNGTFLLILACSAGTAVWLQTRPGMMEKYMEGPAQIAAVALSVYFTFALAGNGLFLMGSRMDLNGNTISYFVLLVIALCPIIYGILGLLEYAMRRSKALKPVEDKKKLRWAGIVFFVLFAGGELWCSLGFYPANMSPDGVDHWLQAIGHWNITNGHPPIFALLIRLLTRIALTPYIYVLFQILLLAYVISKWFTLLYKKGMPFKGLALAVTLFSVMPSNYMMLTLISKNPLFAILNLWLMIQIVLLLDDPQECVRGIRWNVETAISLSGLYLVRYNSFLGAYAAIIIIILISIFHIKCVWWKTMPSLLASLIIINLVQGPLYNQYVEVNTKNSTTLPPLGPLFGSLTVNEVELPEDIIRIMEEALSVEEYRTRYNPYNSDTISWGNPRPNYGDMTTGEGVSIYARMLLQYPDIVIQSRLQGTDLLWSIFQSSDSRGWNHRWLAGIYLTMPRELLPQHLRNVEANNNGLYFTLNKCSEILCSMNNFTAEKPLIDVFVWRNGIYIVFALAFVIVLMVHRKLHSFLMFIPSVASLISLLLMIGWQIYNYIYFFPMAALAFLSCGCAIAAGHSNETEEGNESGTIGFFK